MAVIMNLRRAEGSLEEDSETAAAAAAALREILACLGEPPEIITIGATPAPAETTGHLVRVILPGSKGLNLRSNNEEFVVENVFYSPHYNGLAYRGCGCDGAIGVNRDVKTILAHRLPDRNPRGEPRGAV
jgi:hypothetical protein